MGPLYTNFTMMQYIFIERISTKSHHLLKIFTSLLKHECAFFCCSVTPVYLSTKHEEFQSNMLFFLVFVVNGFLYIHF